MVCFCSFSSSCSLFSCSLPCSSFCSSFLFCFCFVLTVVRRARSQKVDSSTAAVFSRLRHFESVPTTFLSIPKTPTTETTHLRRTTCFSCSSVTSYPGDASAPVSCATSDVRRGCRRIQLQIAAHPVTVDAPRLYLVDDRFISPPGHEVSVPIRVRFSFRKVRDSYLFFNDFFACGDCRMNSEGGKISKILDVPSHRCPVPCAPAGDNSLSSREHTKRIFLPRPKQDDASFFCICLPTQSECLIVILLNFELAAVV